MCQEEPCEDQGEKVDMLAMPGEEPAWHALIRTAGQKMVEHKQSGRGEKLQELAMYILNEFYVADLPEAAYDDAGIAAIYESLCNKIENARESLAHF